MTGIELYNLYRQKLLSLCNCDSDGWDDLEDDDKAVWNALAADVQLRG